MSGHPHKGRRSKWVSCLERPLYIGDYEGRHGEEGSTFRCWFIAGAWYVMGAYDLQWSAMNQFPSLYFYRGLAEKPK